MYYFWGFLISLMFIVLTFSAVADQHHKHNLFLFFHDTIINTVFFYPDWNNVDRTRSQSPTIF